MALIADVCNMDIDESMFMLWRFSFVFLFDGFVSDIKSGQGTAVWQNASTQVHIIIVVRSNQCFIYAMFKTYCFHDLSYNIDIYTYIV
jgi:hypothetical protein